MKLLSLRLRGAIGIREGLGLEEVNIDFRQFGPGLIAIIGENGSGKTTTTDNLHPYRFLRSRPGGLAREFYLKDSCRDLLLSIGEDEYRFLIEMNPTLKKPAIKSYVYKNGETLNPDGNEEGYNAIVARLCGDPDLFFSSVFMTQKRTPFSKVADAKSKDLILELIGAAHLQAKCEYAGNQAKTLKEEIAGAAGEIESLERSIRPLSEIEADIESCRGALSASKSSAIDIDIEITGTKRQLEDWQAKNTAQHVNQSKLSQAKAQLANIQSESTKSDSGYDNKTRQIELVIDGDRTEVEKMSYFCRSEDEAALDVKIAKADQLKADYLATVDGRQEYDRLTTVFSQAKHALDLADRDYVSKIQILKSQLTTAQTKLDDRRTKVEFRRKELVEDIARKKRATQILETVPCQAETIPIEHRDVCKSCQFLKDATAATDEIARLTERLAAGDEEWATLLATLNQEVASVQAAIDNHPSWASIADPLKEAVATAEEAIVALGFDAVLADSIKREYDQSQQADYPGQKQKMRDIRAKVDVLNEKITENRKRLADLDAERTAKSAEFGGQRTSLNDEIADLESQIDVTIELRLDDLRKKLKTAESSKETILADITRAEANIERLTQDKNKASQSTEELDAARRSLSVKQSDLADWEHLSQALSRNGGFQSMLVESAGSEMTPFANQLLALYGLPWTIEIATSKPTDDGKGVKDGFFVIVNKPSGSCELSKLSGGEEVWVDQVIFDAISNMLRRRSGLTLLTAFKDECDGSLDPEKAMEYLKAVEAAHVASHMHHTFVISHRESIQDLIPNRIRFVKGIGITLEAA